MEVGSKQSWGALRFRYTVSSGGYEIRVGREDPTPAPVAGRRGASAARAAASILASVRSPNADELALVPCVCPVGDHFETRELSLGEGQLLADILSMGDSEDEVRTFADKWGLLSTAKWQPVEFYIDLKREIVNARNIGARLGAKGLLTRLRPRTVRADVEMTISSSGQPEIAVYLGHVSGFLMLDLCLKYIGSSKLAQCANSQCKQWFVRKARGSHAQHCSPACRQAAWRAAHTDSGALPH